MATDSGGDIDFINPMTGQHQLAHGALGMRQVLFCSVTGAAPIAAMLFNTPVAVLGDPSNGFKVSPSMLEAQATTRTTGIMLNSPSNPTGSVYAPDELRAILDLAQRRGWFVISDEIYDRLVYEGPAHRAMSAYPGMRERTILIGGFSKSAAENLVNVLKFGSLPFPVEELSSDTISPTLGQAVTLANASDVTRTTAALSPQVSSR